MPYCDSDVAFYGNRLKVLKTLIFALAMTGKYAILAVTLFQDSDGFSRRFAFQCAKVSTTNTATPIFPSVADLF